MKKLLLLCLLLLNGCAVRKLPNPAQQNVWLCKRTITMEPTCAQVDPSGKVPKGSKCKTLPQTGGSEFVVCEK